MTSDTLATCIAACSACAIECDRCLAACLREDDVTMMAGCIELDADCAAICHTAATFLARNSGSASAVCELCAVICEACAAECGQHDAEHCQRCSKACTACAEACRAMI